MRPGASLIATAFIKTALSMSLAIGASPTAANGPASGSGEPHFVSMDAIIVPIVGSDHFEGSLRLKLVLAAKDAEQLDRLTAKLPELRAVSIASSIEFSRLFTSPHTPVDARRLSADLTTALRTTDNGIARVLIVEVSAEN